MTTEDASPVDAQRNTARERRKEWRVSRKRLDRVSERERETQREEEEEKNVIDVIGLVHSF